MNDYYMLLQMDKWITDESRDDEWLREEFEDYEEDCDDGECF